MTWKWIRVKRMFVEHVVLKNEEEMLFVMKRIEKVSDSAIIVINNNGMLNSIEN